MAMAEAIEPPERPRPESGSGAGEARRVGDSVSLLVRWMSIQDANSGGFVHGGTVMRLVDEAAGLAAIKHSGRRVVTAGMDRMTFNTPVFVGELLRCTASVNAVWRTSMEVGVRVEAENPFSGESRHTSTAYLTMVALDEGGPVPAPKLIAETAGEQRREREAELRRANRLAERDQILGGR
jgi:acyl-CoA hydrolase